MLFMQILWQIKAFQYRNSSPINYVIIILFLPDTIPTLFVIYQLCSKQLLPVVGFHNVYCNRFCCSIYCHCSKGRRSSSSPVADRGESLSFGISNTCCLLNLMFSFTGFFFFAITCYFLIPCFINFCRWYKFSFFSLFTTISSLN